jgi:predicted TIM-barrel fold metal-dependent hydrolase
VFALPEWSAEEFERQIVDGGFIGAKVYLSFAPANLKASEVQIFDFIPRHQLEVLHRRGWILMLHIPRPARLRDPVNLEQLLEIDARYPNAQAIVAHAGRAYCPEDIGDAFERLTATRNLRFDISANTNETVFLGLIQAVGARRILFGSDLPITRMRMRRICEDGRYVNLVPRGLYGDVSGDPNMRAIDLPEADQLTLFLYEEIDAFRRAAEAARLSKEDIADVFHRNAEKMFAAASWKR